MSNDELERISRELYWNTEHGRTPDSIKLLRSIEIAALREALEIMMRKLISGVDHTYVSTDAIAELERKIRDLELA